MDAPKCRTCGERHRAGPCPKFERSRGLGKAAGRTGDARKPDEGTPRPREPKPERRHLPTEASLSTSGVTKGEPSAERKAVADGATERRSPRKPKYRGGRPIKGRERETIRAREPWKADGVSERTWWRRQKEKRAEGKA